MTDEGASSSAARANWRKPATKLYPQICKEGRFWRISDPDSGSNQQLTLDHPQDAASVKGLQTYQHFLVGRTVLIGISASSTQERPRSRCLIIWSGMDCGAFPILASRCGRTCTEAGRSALYNRAKNIASTWSALSSAGRPVSWRACINSAQLSGQQQTRKQGESRPRRMGLNGRANWKTVSAR